MSIADEQRGPTDPERAEGTGSDAEWSGARWAHGDGVAHVDAERSIGAGPGAGSRGAAVLDAGRGQVEALLGGWGELYLCVCSSITSCIAIRTQTQTRIGYKPCIVDWHTT